MQLFDADDYEDWRPLWRDMPAFDTTQETETDSITVKFSNYADKRAFLTDLGYPPERRKTVWWPYRKQMRKPAEYEAVPPNRYPIYVISKGRWESRHTVRALDRLGIRYTLVIEPQEEEQYASRVKDPSCIAVLPFSNLGQGSIPARNWVLDDAKQIGAKRHWILDDNISGFARIWNGERLPITNINPFTSVEDWVDRYRNVIISGLQYRFFANPKDRLAPIKLNTRVYSCILIDNSIRHRWRGRYNEDTDLSLRVLKDGDCTALFYHHLADKLGTMTVKGGNTDELYRQEDGFDGRYEMAKSLQDQHPDVVKITRKWGRWQHHVDYRPFATNRLELAE